MADAPPPMTYDDLRPVELRLVRARRLGDRWARLEDAEALAIALRRAWDEWPQSRPAVAFGRTSGEGRTLSSAFGGRTWDVMSVPRVMAEAAGDVEVAAAMLRVMPRELRGFMDEYYPGWERRWLPPAPDP